VRAAGQKLLAHRARPAVFALGVKAQSVYAAIMATALLKPGTEDLLEWVLLLSLTTSGLCVLSLVVMMLVGRWQHNVRQRAKNRRRRILRSDIRDLEARRWRPVKHLMRFESEIDSQAVAPERLDNERG
jgi:hypothetical protein